MPMTIQCCEFQGVLHINHFGARIAIKDRFNLTKTENNLMAHSEVTASRVPCSFRAIHLTARAASSVMLPCSSSLSLIYRRTHPSSLPDSQQSSYEKKMRTGSCSIEEHWRTEAARVVTGCSASVAFPGSCSAPSAAFQTRTAQSEPPVKAWLR